MGYYELDSVRDRLLRSLKFEHFVGYLIQHHLEGVGIIHPPRRVRAETESRKPYARTNDVITFSEGQPRKTVSLEVKSKRVRFTSDPDSWPWEDVTLFNASKECDPFAIVFCSDDARHKGDVLVVLRTSRPAWFTRPQKDNAPERGGLEYPVWAVASEHLVSFDVFLDALKTELFPATALSNVG